MVQPVDYPVLAITVGLALTLLVATFFAGALERKAFSVPAYKGRIGCVDGLRGYLALAVLVHHSIMWMQELRFGMHWSEPPVHAFNQLGVGSVGLFFMITGLVFYPRIREGFGETKWCVLAITRAFRILPLQAVTILLITVILMVQSGRSPDADYLGDFFRWLTTLGLPDLLGIAESGRMKADVFWSLHYEWIFYLAVLPLSAIAQSFLRPVLPASIVPLALIVGGIIGRPFDWFLPIIPFLPLFGIGMLAFEICEISNARAFLASRVNTVLAASFLLIGFVRFHEPYSPIAMTFLGYFLISVAAGNSMFGLLTRRGARALGEWSFGIYLLHGMILAVLVRSTGYALENLAVPVSFVALPLLAAPITVFVAALGNVAVERPGIAFGKALAQRLGRRGNLTKAQIRVAP